MNRFFIPCTIPCTILHNEMASQDYINSTDITDAAASTESLREELDMLLYPMGTDEHVHAMKGLTRARIHQLKQILASRDLLHHK